MFLSLSFSFPSSLKINKYNLLKITDVEHFNAVYHLIVKTQFNILGLALLLTLLLTLLKHLTICFHYNHVNFISIILSHTPYTQLLWSLLNHSWTQSGRFCLTAYTQPFLQQTTISHCFSNSLPIREVSTKFSVLGDLLCLH